MPYWTVIWTDEAWEKVSQRGLNHEDVEEVARFPARRDASRSSGRPLAIGWTAANEMIVVVYEQIDSDTIIIITAFRPE